MKLQHKDTEAVIEVPDNASLGVYERAGWALAPEPDLDEPDVPEGSQLLPDVPPSETGETETKGRKPRA